MTVKIKNCGLKTPEAIREAAKTGASFIGFVHHPASPRHLPLPEIAALIEHMPPALAQVIVLVDPSDELLDDLQRHVRPHFLQIHNVKDPQRIRDISKRTAIHLITALRIYGEFDARLAQEMEPVSKYLLFDAHHDTLAGGSGNKFDWTKINGAPLKKSWFLAGGLTAENVAEALRITHAPMVDVSSGIEDAPGIKSLEKIAAFNKAALAVRL